MTAAMRTLVNMLTSYAVLLVIENPPGLLMKPLVNIRTLCIVLPMMEDRIVIPA